jgi:hypothetical protein
LYRCPTPILRNFLKFLARFKLFLKNLGKI